MPRSILKRSTEKKKQSLSPKNSSSPRTRKNVKINSASNTISYIPTKEEENRDKKIAQREEINKKLMLTEIRGRTNSYNKSKKTENKPTNQENNPNYNEKAFLETYSKLSNRNNGIIRNTMKSIGSIFKRKNWTPNKYNKST
jgi:5-formyltetrahydrofolate cyclo-ligase